MGKNKSVFTAVLVVILSIFFLETLNSKKPKHPDAGLNIVQLVEKYEYPIEIHEVVTEDGYIVTLHRIPHGRKNTSKRGIPVLLMHGLMHSGVDFVVLGPNKALALLLADRGFDVWLGNVRGTTWSKKHQNLDPYKDRQFWDFSLHEIGTYDVPAFIDYILTVTDHDDLHYIGFSQGAMTFFILTSEKPEYAHKVKLVTTMAPAMFIKNPKGLALTVFAYFTNWIEMFFNVFHVDEFFSNNGLFAFYLRTICNENSMFVDLCLFHIYSVQGFNFEGTNKTMLSLIYTNTPAGMPTKQLVHVLQLMSADDFQQFDLGTAGNLEKYGQTKPPIYDLSKAITPVAVYYARNDWAVNIENIKKVEKSLPNIIKSYQVPLEKFNHDDFVHSDDAPNTVYESVIEDILKYH